MDKMSRAATARVSIGEQDREANGSEVAAPRIKQIAASGTEGELDVNTADKPVTVLPRPDGCRP